MTPPPKTNITFDFKIPKDAKGIDDRPLPKKPPLKKPLPRKPVALSPEQYSKLPKSVQNGKGLTTDQYSLLPPDVRMAVAGGFQPVLNADRAAEGMKKEELRKGTKKIEASEIKRKNQLALSTAAKEEKRQKEIYKTAAKAGFDIRGAKVGSDAAASFARSTGDVLVNAAGDFPEIAKGLKDVGKYIGKAALSDIKTGRGILGVSQTFNPAVIPYRLKEGTLFSALDPSGKKSEFDKVSEELIKGIPASLASLADLETWKNDPIIQLLNAGSIIFPAARLGGMSKLTASFGRANEWMTPVQQVKAAVIESYRPGLIALHGIEGGITKRNIVDSTGKTFPNSRPTSKSPLGRAGQKQFERWSTNRSIQNPNSRWGADARTQKNKARQAALDLAKETAKQAPTVSALTEGVRADGPKGLNIIKEAFAGIVRTDPAAGALVNAAIMGPRSSDISEAGNLSVQEMGARLSENKIHLEMQNVIDDGRASMEKIQERLDEINNDPDGSEGFEDEIQGLMERWKVFNGVVNDSQEQLDFNLKRQVHPVRDSPNRENVLRQLTEQYGKPHVLAPILKKQQNEVERWKDAIAKFIASPPGGISDVAVLELKRMQGELALAQRIVKQTEDEIANTPVNSDGAPTEAILYMDAIARSIYPDMPQRLYDEISVQLAKNAEGLVDPLFKIDPKDALKAGNVEGRREVKGRIKYSVREGIDSEHAKIIDLYNAAVEGHHNATDAFKPYKNWTVERINADVNALAAKNRLAVADGDLEAKKADELFYRLHSEINPEVVDSASRRALAERLVNEYSGRENALPPRAGTVEEIERIISFADEMTTRGRKGRMWYENSAKAIKKYARGSMKKAVQIAQVLAIYSPQQPIIGNTSLAVRALNEFNATGEVTTVGQDWQKAAATSVLKGENYYLNDQAAKWKGRKTNNFAFNFIEEIDRKLFKLLRLTGNEVTSDLWMARVFGYFTSAVSDGRYDVIESIVQQIAKERGWKPKQVQAAIWTAIKEASDDVTANIDFEQGLKMMEGQINYESIPGLNVSPTLHNAYLALPPERRVEYTGAKANLVDDFLAALGFTGRTSELGPGAYYNDAGVFEENLGATAIIQASLAPAASTKKKINLYNAVVEEFKNATDAFKPYKDWTADEVKADVNALAARERLSKAEQSAAKAEKPVLPYRLPVNERAGITFATAAIAWALKQDSVAWVRPFVAKAMLDADAIIVPTGRRLTDAEASAIAQELGASYRVVHMGDQGFMVRNFGAGDNKTVFRPAVKEALRKHITYEGELVYHASDGELVNSQEYPALRGSLGDRGGSPEVLRATEAADQLARESHAIDIEYFGANAAGTAPALDPLFQTARQQIASVRFIPKAEAASMKPRRGYVYHGTNKAEAIISSGKILGREDYPGAQNYAWFSTDPAYAAEYGSDVLEIPRSALPRSVGKHLHENGPNVPPSTTFWSQEDVSLLAAETAGKPPLAQRAGPVALSLKEHEELASLYKERQQLKEFRGENLSPTPTLESDRSQVVQDRIDEIERSTQGEVLGATEGVGTPNRRITLMPGATNGTFTFEHETLHATVQSLDERGQKALSETYAGGNSVPTWTRYQHEQVAEGYEKWKRDSKSVPQIVHDAFSRMEQGGYHNTVILDENQVNQVTALMADIVRALRSGDLSKMAAAADAAELIGMESEAVLLRILTRNKTADQILEIEQMLANRKNNVTDRYRELGIIGPDEEARGFLSHFDVYDALSNPSPGPTRLSATTDTVASKVNPDPRALSLKKNKLIRYQLGEMLQDPTILYWQLRQRWKIEQTMDARDDLWDVGTPIQGGEIAPKNLRGRNVVILRNPNRTPETIDSVTKAIQQLSVEDLVRIQSRSGDQGIDFQKILDQSNATDISDTADELYYDSLTMKTEPEWMQTETDLRVVPRNVAVARLGNTFSSSPTGSAAAIWGSLNGLTRAALIYAPGLGARYVGRNYLQNMVLLLVTNPSGLQYLLSGSGRLMRETEPKLYALMLNEIGSFQATALPEFNTRARNRAQSIERGIVDRSRGAGEALGKYADIPLRSAAYRSNAAKWGFSSMDDIKRLLDEEHPDYDSSKAGEDIRDTIRQQTRDDMIDFDALSPAEKEAVTRLFFIWPFMRGAAKWPAMYVREYPGRASALSLLASSQGALQTEPEGGLRDRWQTDIPGNAPLGFGGKEVSFGWLSPTGVIENFAQSSGAAANSASEGKINIKDILGGYLAPQYKELIDLLANNDVNAIRKIEQMVKEFVPGAKDILQVISTARGKQDLQQLALQFLGIQVTPNRSATNKASKWADEIDAAIIKIGKKNGGSPTRDQVQGIEHMKAAYQDWTKYEAKINVRALNEGRSRGLTGEERLTGVIQVAQNNYPSIFKKFNDAAQSRGFSDIDSFIGHGKNRNARARWVADKMYTEMFGFKSNLTRASNK